MDKTDMRAVDINSNLKNWPAWDYKDYRLNEKEAKACTDALDNYIWHSVEKQGMPSENGYYLFKVEYHGHGSIPVDEINSMDLDELIERSNLYCYFASPYIHDDQDSFKHEIEDMCEGKLTHWRKIIDNKNAYMEES